MPVPEPKEMLWKKMKIFGGQNKFALRVGVDPSVVSRVVNGHMLLDERRQSMWALLLDEPVEKLFPGD